MIKKPYTGKDVIQVDGVCYQFVEFQPGQATDPGIIEASFDECNECGGAVIGDALLNEISPFDDFFDLFNPSSEDPIDVSDFWACSGGTCVNLGELINSSSSSSSVFVPIFFDPIVPPEDKVRITIPGFLSNSDGDLAVFRSGDITNAAEMMDYVQWGDAGNDSESLAEDKGIWTAGTFVTAPVDDSETIKLVDSGEIGVDRWAVLLKGSSSSSSTEILTSSSSSSSSTDLLDFSTSSDSTEVLTSSSSSSQSESSSSSSSSSTLDKSTSSASSASSNSSSSTVGESTSSESSDSSNSSSSTAGDNSSSSSESSNSSSSSVAFETLLLNGSSQYVDFKSYDDIIPPGSNGFSISSWINVDNTSGDKGIYYEATSNGDSFTKMLLRVNGSSIQGGGRTTPAGSFINFGSHGTITASTWHHVVMTVSDGSQRFYIDGSDVGGDTESFSGISASSSSRLKNIGATQVNNSGFEEWFDGSISNVMVFNEFLSSGEVTELYNSGVAKQPWEHSEPLREAMILALPLNAKVASGRHIEDFSGNELDATEVASPTLTGDFLDFSNNKVYQGFEWDASLQWIDCGNDSSLQFGGTAAITCGAWIWLDSAGNGTFRNVIRQDGGYYFRLTNTNKLFWKTYVSADLTSSADVPTDQWVHVMCTYDGSNLRYYENGQLKDTQAATGNMPVDTSIIAIGATSDGLLEPFYGSIVQPMIFNRVLSASEIDILYNQNLPKDYSQLPTSITDDCVLCLELTSNDDTLTDLSSEGNDGTNNNGLAADGQEIDWDTGSVTVESSSSSSSSSNSSSSTVGESTSSDSSSNSSSSSSTAGDNSSSSSSVAFETLALNGSNQYLELNDGLWDTNTEDFSVSSWFYLDAHSGTSAIWDKEDSVPNAEAGLFVHSDNSLKFRIWNTADATAGTAETAASAISTGQWYHAVCVKEGSDIHLYLDNASPISSTWSGTAGSVSEFRIGAQGFGSISNYADGSMSNIMVFDRPLSSSDISELYNSGVSKQPWEYSESIRNSLLAAYPLNAKVASGRHLEDFSGNELDITAINSPTLTGEYLDFSANKVYDTFGFDGTDDYVSVAHDNAFNFSSNDFAIELYLYRDDSSNKTIFNKALDGSNYFQVTLTNSSLITIWRSNGSNWTINTTSAMPVNEWFHLVIQRNGSNLETYMNGQSNGSGSISGSAADITVQVEIMASVFDASYSDGSISSYKVFDRKLTETEIETLYNQNLPKDYSQLPTSITNDCILALEMTSNDNSLNDLSGNGNNGTANGSVTSDGQEIDWDDTGTNIESSSSSSSESSSSTVNQSTSSQSSSSSTEGDNSSSSSHSSSSTGFEFSTLALNGTDEYVDYGNDTSLQTTGNMSAFIWMRATSVPGSNAYAFGKYNTVGNNRGWAIILTSSGSFRVIVSPDGTSTSNDVEDSSFSTNTWFHVGFVYNGSTLKLYVNGTEEDSISYSSGVFNSNGDVLIGSINGGSANHFGGFLSAPVIYNTDISTSVISELYNGGTPKQIWELSEEARTNLVLASPLNAGVASDREFEDFSGKENDGTSVNGGLIDGTTLEFTATNKVYNTFGFIGSDGEYLTCGNDASLNIDNMTVSFWVNVDSGIGGGSRILVEKWQPSGGTQRTFTVQYDNSSTEVFFLTSTNGTSSNQIMVTQDLRGEWYHIACTYDGSNMRIYINGSDVSSGALSGNLFNGTANLTIGGRDNNTLAINADMTQVMLFDRALSPSEISIIYNQNLPKDYSQIPTSITDDCVAALEMTSNDDSLTDLSTNTNDGTAVGTVTADGVEIDWDTTGTNVESSSSSSQSDNSSSSSSSSSSSQSSSSSSVAFQTMLFNGSSQYLDLGDELDANTDDISLMCWFKGSGSDESLISKQNDGDANWWLLNLANSGKIRMDLRVDGSNFRTIETTSSFNDNNWHLAIIFVDRSAGTITINVDGVNEGTTTVSSSGSITGSQNNTASLMIGRRDSASQQFFDGSMSNAIISIGHNLTSFATELYNSGVAKQPWEYSEAIRETYSLALPLNAKVASSRHIEDFSGNELDATEVGSPTLTGDYLDFSNNKVYDAFGFDGSDDYVDLGNVLDFGSNDFALCGWIKVDSTSSGNQGVFHRYDSAFSESNRCWRVEYNHSTGFLEFLVQGSGVFTQHDTTIPQDEWVFFYTQYDDSGQEIGVSINGGSISTSSHTNGINSGGASITTKIGVTTDGLEHFEGDLTSFKAFNRLLTQTEIEALYNQNLPKDYADLPTSLTDDCVLALEMTSNDNSLNDLSTSNNDGTAFGGVTSNGSEIDWDDSSTNIESSSSSSQSSESSSSTVNQSTSSNSSSSDSSSSTETFFPDSLAGLDLWVDSSDANTLYTDAGSTNVSSDLDNIQEWHDKSGNSNNFTQTTSADRPAYRTSAQNSLDSVEFDDGNTEYMLGTKPSSWATDMDFTFSMVFKSDNASIRQIPVSASDSTNANKGGFFIDWNGASNYVGLSIFESGSWKDTNFISGALDTDVHIYSFTVSGTSVVMYLDGVQVNTVTLTSGLDMDFTNDFEIGRIHQGSSLYVSGLFNEMVMYDNALSTSDRNDLEEYLWNRWTGESLNSSSSSSSSTVNLSTSSSSSTANLSTSSESSTSGDIQSASPANLNGTNHFFSHADNASLSTGDIDWSFGVWVKGDSFSTAPQLISKQDSGGTTEYYVRITSGGQASMALRNGDTLNHSETLNTDEWYFIYYEHDAVNNTLGISVNAGTIETGATSQVGIDTSATFRIGAINTSTTSFHDGGIGYIGFWKRKLTTEEITQLYNIGKPLDYNCLNPGLKVNLESYWHLDGDALDSHGTNDLTNNNSVPFDATGLQVEDCATLSSDSSSSDSSSSSNSSSSVANQTMSFNGTSQYTRNTPLSPSSDALSVSFWFNAGDTSGTQMIASQFDGGNSAVDRRLFYCWLNGTTLQFSFSADDTTPELVQKTGISAGTWYHVMGVFDGSDIYLYVDNTEEDTASFVKTLNTSNVQDLSIGAQWNLSTGTAALHFNGSISGMNVFNYALTASDRAELYNSGVAKQPWEHSESIRSSMVLALPLNAKVASGRHIEDFSGKENDATEVGSPTLTGDYLDFSNNKVYDTFLFNGSSEAITTPYEAPNGDFSFSIWINTASGASLGSIISEFADTGRRYSVRATATSFYLEFGNGVQTYSLLTTDHVEKWAHVCFVYDGANAIFYLNGEQIDSRSATIGNQLGTDMTIGYLPDNAQHFDGSMTQAMMFNRSLTTEEVSILYNQNLPKDYADLPTSLTNDCDLCYEMTSNDNSLNDLAGSNNGTTVGGITSDGDEIDWDVTSTLVVSSSSSSSSTVGLSTSSMSSSSSSTDLLDLSTSSESSMSTINMSTSSFSSSSSSSSP